MSRKFKIFAYETNIYWCTFICGIKAREPSKNPRVYMKTYMILTVTTCKALTYNAFIVFFDGTVFECTILLVKLHHHNSSGQAAPSQQHQLSSCHQFVMSNNFWHFLLVKLPHQFLPAKLHHQFSFVSFPIPFPLLHLNAPLFHISHLIDAALVFSYFSFSFSLFSAFSPLFSVAPAYYPIYVHEQDECCFTDDKHQHTASYTHSIWGFYWLLFPQCVCNVELFTGVSKI